MANSTRPNAAAVIRFRGRMPKDQSGTPQGNRIGQLVGWNDHVPLVDYPGNLSGPLLARVLSSVQLPAPESAPGVPCEVLLVFHEERADMPVIVGVLEPPGALKKTGESNLTPKPEVLEAKVDGRRVAITAQDEIELRCGEASLVLRRNGRVVIRGAYLETRARGTNRIRGGMVEIN